MGILLGTGSYAAARMAEMTGVPASTWEAIIAVESNGQINATMLLVPVACSKQCQLGFNCNS